MPSLSSLSSAAVIAGIALFLLAGHQTLRRECQRLPNCRPSAAWLPFILLDPSIFIAKVWQ